jgi:hypothetical protein
MRKAMFLIAAAAAVSAAPASGAILVFKANMTGAAERPTPVTSDGTGTALVVIDTVLNRMSVDADFADLESPTTVAHIHCCAGVDATASVATTTPSFPGFPVGVTSGDYFRIFNMLSASTYRAGFITANGGTPAGARDALIAGLNGGLAYFNVHTQQFSGGEIRGQFALAVPEPATWAMMLGGFGLTGWGLRRRTPHLA